MDNTTSSARIVTPEVPTSVENEVGSTKTSLVQYILALIGKARITGINETESETLDVGQLASKIATVEQNVAILLERTPRKISTPGVNGTVVTLNITPNMPSNLYDVDLAIVGGAGAIPAHNWAVVSGSKTISQVQVQITGNLTAYTLDFTLTPTHNL